MIHNQIAAGKKYTYSFPFPGKRSSLATLAETASIATNSSANTFIVKSDDGLNSKAGNSNYGMMTQNKAGNSNSNLTAEAVDLIEESLLQGN